MEAFSQDMHMEQSRRTRATKIAFPLWLAEARVGQQVAVFGHSSCLCTVRLRLCRRLIVCMSIAIVIDNLITMIIISIIIIIIVT